MGRKLRRIVRLAEVLDRRGRSRAQHYVDIDEGVYTHPVKLTPNGKAVGYPDYEVDELEHAMLAGWSAKQVKALVAELEKSRLGPAPAAAAAVPAPAVGESAAAVPA